MECSALSRLRFHLDGAAVLLHHGVGDRQAQPVALLLRGEERLEDARKDLGGDPDPGIVNADTHILAVPQMGIYGSLYDQVRR